MIAIVDGGSTKCDWVLISPNGTEQARFATAGFNPNLISAEQILEELKKMQTEQNVSASLSHLYFYGSGCGTVANQNTIKDCLQQVFPTAKIQVKEDTLAAAYAVYKGTPTMVGILGTGSNSCFFDGKNIRLDLPSLGFILGDEGSGTAIGKALVKRFFMKKFPEDLAQKFQETYSLTVQELIKKLYHEPRANAFFASFNPFAVENKDHLYIRNMLKEEFSAYIEYQILPYPEAQNHTLGLVGSIAKIYEDILAEVAEEHHIQLGTIVPKPIENLVQYHIQYIL